MKQIFFFVLFFTFVGVASAQSLLENNSHYVTSNVESAKMRDNAALRIKRQQDVGRLVNEASTKILQRVEEPIDELVKGSNRGFVLSENTDHSISPDEQYSIELQVNYDPRPIGGIVSIEARVTPAFTGIGVARRVIRKETGAYAIEVLNTQTVQKFVSLLLNELSKNEESTTVAEKTAN